jgi:hypothetical protein
MRFQTPTKLEVFLDGFRNCLSALDYYNEMNDYKSSRIEFWEVLSDGWMNIYIYPYDDPFNRNISKERKLRIGK